MTYSEVGKQALQSRHSKNSRDLHRQLWTSGHPGFSIHKSSTCTTTNHPSTSPSHDSSTTNSTHTCPYASVPS